MHSHIKPFDSAANPSASAQADTAVISPAARRAIVAFYASTKHGSEYRAGADFIRFAAESGFDLALIADLEKNSKPSELATGHLRVEAIPSPIVQQDLLYRFTDFIPQLIWHWRVAKHLRAQDVKLEQLWIQNGAQPWLPLSPYRDVTRSIIWGPIGGGAPPNAATMAKLDGLTRFRESLRTRIERFFMRRKQRLLLSQGFPRLNAIARTQEAQDNLRLMAPELEAPVIPEILDPVEAQSRTRLKQESPRFVWVGQDIPRKNLPTALDLFSRLRTVAFPNATLDVFGIALSEASSSPPGVFFRGWVSSIEWESYRHDGVMLLTSYREGLPSVVLEATAAGLLCVVSDVGSLRSLELTTMHVLNHCEYPQYSDQTVIALAERVRGHLNSDHVEIRPVNFRSRLKAFLKSAENY